MKATNYKWTTLLRKFRRKELMTDDELKEFNRMVDTCPVKARQLKLWTDPQEFARQCQLYDSINTEECWARLVAAHPDILTLDKRSSQSPRLLIRLWRWLRHALHMIYRLLLK